MAIEGPPWACAVPGWRPPARLLRTSGGGGGGGGQWRRWTWRVAAVAATRPFVNGYLKATRGRRDASCQGRPECGAGPTKMRCWVLPQCHAPRGPALRCAGLCCGVRTGKKKNHRNSDCATATELVGMATEGGRTAGLPSNCHLPHSAGFWVEETSVPGGARHEMERSGLTKRCLLAVALGQLHG